MNDMVTICEKVQKCAEEIERGVKTGSLDLLKLSQNLSAIRKDGQKMEDGLKLRKKMMEKAGIEEEYQKAKDKAYTPPGINKMPTKQDVQTNNALTYHITVTDKCNGKNEVIYDNDVYGGVFSSVERVDEIDENADITGQTQQFSFGHDLTIWFAFNQLEHSLQSKGTQIMLAIRNAIENKTFKDPAKKQRLLDLMNNKP